MGKIFKRGLIALAPVAISLAVIVWLFRFLEEIFSIPLKWLVGNYYFPGMGLIVAFVFIFFVGIIINNFLMQKLTNWFDRILAKIPFFKTVYNSIADMMNYFKPKEKGKRGKMVVVEIDSFRFLAMLTREEFSGLPDELGGDEDVTIYVPLSYQIGGFTIIVPRSKIKPINLSVEEGMRFVVTAGMTGNKK